MDSLWHQVTDYLDKNKEWLFGGLGLVVLSSVRELLWKGAKKLWGNRRSLGGMLRERRLAKVVVVLGGLLVLKVVLETGGLLHWSAAVALAGIVTLALAALTKREDPPTTPTVGAPSPNVVPPLPQTDNQAAEEMALLLEMDQMRKHPVIKNVLKRRFGPNAGQ